MESIGSLLAQHPGAVWTAVAAIVGLVVLRALAKLACLATLVGVALILVACVLAAKAGLA